MEEKLSKAILSGNIEFLRSYINEGGHFNTMTLKSPDGYGKKPLELAVLSQIKHDGSSEITKLIIENSDIEDQAEVLVALASEDKGLKEVNILLESGVSVDVLHNGQSALQRATGNSNVKMVHLLLHHGADPNKKGEYGTALELAEEMYYEPAYIGMMEGFLKGQPKSPFDFVDKDKVKKRLITWAICLENFGKNHKDQTFYVLAINGGKLIANSEEAFRATLKTYQDQFPSYNQPEKIQALKYSPGDFSFHQIETEIEGAIEEYKGAIDFSFMQPQENDTRTEKDLLIEGVLKNKQVYTQNIKITNDFRMMTPGHSY
ncbi:ankyrin repeat domain-containing protein [Aquimarina sp. AU58]|uniref:ankyrin repeat domain-containing protein n=1 Tax=Aquimarina sp. AU58 TaxID=1874112 RepID=UPI000D65AD06|nr:ankyrin repeat domain-containing protein [Aquimarina sp. AU58]